MNEPIPTATKCALYTPTTGQVREEFATRMSPAMDATRRPAFDRWLAYHDAQVRREAKIEGLREMAWKLEPGTIHESPYVKAGRDIIRIIEETADQLEQEGKNDD